MLRVWYIYTLRYLTLFCYISIYYTISDLSYTNKKQKEEDFTDPKFLSTSNPLWTKQVGVPQDIIDVLSHKGITHFTPVQAKAIRPVLAGRDVIGRSRTGTGKTLAFGIPALIRLVDIAKANGNADVMRDGSIRMRKGRLPGMIVLCPTRELARQVGEELMAVCKPLGLYSAVFHGGVSYEPQVSFDMCCYTII